MSMGIMWERYCEAEITPAEFVAKEIYYEKERYAFKKSPENFSGNEHTEKFIVPLTWNDELKIYGMVAPLNMPIYADSEKSFKEVKQTFLANWKQMWGGELFWEYLWIVPENVKKSKSQEIQSYVNWKNSPNKERLAFIYLGHFWLYKDETETLNQATKRFFEKHADVLLLEAFKHECEKKCWEKDSNNYAKAILNDGAILFTHSQKALSKIHTYADPSAVLWRSLCILGYFPWIKRLDFFTEWDYDEYLR